jgi:hypothetical protein
VTPALISDAEAVSIREALGIFLVHVCTVRVVTAGPEDTHGNATSVLGDPVTVACTFHAQTRVRIDEGGTAFVMRPTIDVAVGVDVQTGYEISEIRNAQNVTLAAGPFMVGQALNDDPLGVTLQRSFELRGTDAVRS